MKLLISNTYFVALLLVFLVSAQAQETPSAPHGSDQAAPGGQHEPPCGPPPEAYKACEGKSAGSRSEFASPHGDVVKGFCENEGNGKIVLRPDRPPGEAQDGRRGPPPEAYAACVGKSAGGRAQFVSPKGETITGTCDEEGGKLVLRPDRPPKNPVEDRPAQ